MKNTMKIILVSIFITSIAITPSNAKWTKTLNFAFTLNQSKSKIGSTGTLYSKESLNYGILIDGELTEDVEKYNWKNTLKLDCSTTKTKDETDTTSTGKWAESNDALKIDSVRRWKTFRDLNPYAALNLQTSIRDANFANEWIAFRPFQLRESAGLSSPLLSQEKQELIARTGLFFQHYANNPASSGLYEKSSGMELVLDYKNKVAENMSLTSKAGFYSSFNATQDPWNTLTKSKKIRLEWDNTLIATLNKYLSFNISWNIDNIDTTSSHANYEWEETLNIALNWKVF